MHKVQGPTHTSALLRFKRNFKGLIKDKMEIIVPSSRHTVRISEITFAKYLAHKDAQHKDWFCFFSGEDTA